jgi:hypothetical protein
VRLPAPVSGRARVEDPKPAIARVEGNVRVTVDDEVRIGERRTHPAQPALGLAAVVDHRDLEAGQLDLQGGRGSPGSNVRAVIVADHRVYWRVFR